eukprot:COSAG02_NODE_47246_length_342_cov_1.263374_1_plen_40_part_10
MCIPVRWTLASCTTRAAVDICLDGGDVVEQVRDVALIYHH